MTRESIKSAVTYYIQSLGERSRREKSGTKWGIDWVVYNLGLARFGKPVRLPFLRSGDAGFPKSKVEAEFGVDLAFLSEDGRDLTIFVLKDEPLTNSTWTRNDFDRDLRMAMAPDLNAEGLEQVASVTIILAYNKDDQQNGVEAYERFVGAAPESLRNGISLGFRRWNLSELVEQTTGHALSPALLPERFFGQLSYLSAQAADFPHGSDAWVQQLVPNWRRFIQDVLAENTGVRGPALIAVALIIVRQQADGNESIGTGWLDLMEWAAIALWKLSAEQQDPEITASVVQFWRNFYIAELERFYRTHIEEIATEQAVDHASTGSFVGTVAAAYIMYWHIGRLGVLAISSAGMPEREDGGRTQFLHHLGNWAAMLVNASPSVFRPLLDIQHIEFFLLIELFRLAGRADELSNLIRPLVDRLYLRRIGHSDLPFLDGNNSLDNVLEQVATKPQASLLLTASSSFVLMLLEVSCSLPDEVREETISLIHRRLVLGAFDTGPAGDQKPLYLMSWLPPENWAKQDFDPGREGGQSVASGPLADNRDAPAGEILEGIRRLVARTRAAAPPLSIPEEIPLGAAVLASMRYRKPLPPELWRRWAFR
jgi:hypothetical protein